MKFDRPKGCSVILLSFLLFASGQTRAQVLVQIGKNFAGSTYGVNTPYIPADGNGAIGPRHFMEFINGTVAVYNKTNGLSVQRKTNLKFWSDAGLIISPDSALSDPRVLYDPSVQRWFATQINVNGSASDPSLEANDFLLAISTTSDPTSPWRAVAFQSDPDNGYFADFPTIGIDANAVYLSGDFYHGEEFPIGPGLVSLPKADLLATIPTIANRTWFGVMDYAVRGDVLQPAICFDGSSTGNVLAMIDIGSDSTPFSNIVSFAVQNAGTPSATLTAASHLDIPPYIVPFNFELGLPNFNPTQPDDTSYLSANDARISANVYAVNGVLYAVHSTEFAGHIAIRWYRISATTRTLLEVGTITDANLDLFYPSIAANNDGTVVIGCNGSSSTTYVSSFAFVGQTINGVTTFGAPTLLQSGVIEYHGDDEFLAELLEEPLSSRWGDYSATSVDPTNPTHFWTIQMIPSDEANADVWSTHITEIITTQPVTPPILSITLSNNNTFVSWPISNGIFNLESKTNLGSTNGWTLIAQNLSTNNGRVSFQSALTNQTTFFRLHKP
ncbi:MAG: hypothetical protein JWM68_2621 [Verrucomicrobiales bacterium]|nr:hypothetical protein [Verrucomicrobiales bacterium]